LAGRKNLTKDQIITKQQEVMQVVESIFARNHPNNIHITMNQIAKKANIAKGTLYLYFKGKEELIFKTYVKSLKLKNEELEFEFNKHDLWLEKYKSFFSFYYDFFQRYPYYLGIQTYCENGGFDRSKLEAKVLKEYQQIARKTRSLVNTAMQRCVNEGSLKTDLNVEITTFNYSRALRGVIFFCIYTFPKHYLNLNNICSARQFYDNFVHILLAGMQA